MAAALAALACPEPPRARACPAAPRYAHVVSRPNMPAVVPIGSPVLIEYTCVPCTSAMDEAPQVEVSDQAGMRVPGAARWLSAPGGWSAHAVWEPELPLAEGKYALTWITPATNNMSKPLPFVVIGDPSEAPQVEFEAVLDAVATAVGDPYQCVIGTCGPTITTQQRMVPILTARPAQEPSASDIMQFMFRVKAAGMEGAWHSLGDESVNLSAQFESSHDRYCLTVEAMRVSDGEIMQLGEHCADDTIGDLEARPTPYLQTCFEEDEPAFDAPREMYRKAWCSDNAEACTQHADANADACGDYTMVCGTDDTRADAGATETAPDAGATETAPDAGDDTDQAHIDGRNPRSGDDHTSGSCAVQPARAGSNMLAGWIALAAAWLMRRREQR